MPETNLQTIPGEEPTPFFFSGCCYEDEECPEDNFYRWLLISNPEEEE